MKSLMIPPVLAATYLDPEYHKWSWSANPFDLKNCTKVDCAFQYWTEQDSKVFSQLAWIVFAVPMTQVSVERLFSGVKFMLSDLRNSLAEDTLQAITLQRTNVWAYQFSVHMQYSPASSFSFIKRVSSFKLFLYLLTMD